MTKPVALLPPLLRRVPLPARSGPESTAAGRRLRWTIRLATLGVGLALIPRWGMEAHLLRTEASPKPTLAAVEPGLFAFDEIPADAPAAPETDPAPAAAPVPVPPRRPAIPRTIAAAEPQVQRFDLCLPDCESRDPTRSGVIVATLASPAGPATAPAHMAAAGPIPPLPITGGTPVPGPLTASITVVEGVVSQMGEGLKSLTRLSW